MAGGVVQVFLSTKSTSEADRCRKQRLRPISIGEKYVQLLYMTIGIMKIMFSAALVPKTSRLIDQQISLGTVLLFKLTALRVM